MGLMLSGPPKAIAKATPGIFISTNNFIDYYTPLATELIEVNIGISKDFNNFELQKALANMNKKKAYQIAQDYAPWRL